MFACLKRMCLNCHVVTGENRKCPKCKEMGPTIKNNKGYFTELQFAGRTLFMSPQQIRQELSMLSLSDARQLGLGVLPSEMIVNHVVISTPLIRPDRRVQNSVKSQDDYTVSLQAITKHCLLMNEMSESDPKFARLYESFSSMMRDYQVGKKGEEADPKSKSLAASLCGKEGRIRQNMLGKRINNCGRCVTACDTTNAPDEATLPLEFVKTI